MFFWISFKEKIEDRGQWTQRQMVPLLKLGMPGLLHKKNENQNYRRLALKNVVFKSQKAALNKQGGIFILIN